MVLEFTLVGQIIWLVMFFGGVWAMVFTRKQQYIGMGSYGLAMGLYGWMLVVLDVGIAPTVWFVIFGAVILILAIILQGVRDQAQKKGIRTDHIADDAQDIHEAFFAVFALVIALINGGLLFFTPVALETVCGVLMLTVNMAMFLYLAGTTALNARRLSERMIL